MAATAAIKPALVVVDMQEDFCPPVGLDLPIAILYILRKAQSY
jgi:nicotinamidase-related amidase